MIWVSGSVRLKSSIGGGGLRPPSLVCLAGARDQAPQRATTSLQSNGLTT